MCNSDKSDKYVCGLLAEERTYWLLVGQQHVHEEGHAYSVCCGHNDVRVAGVWCDDHLLGVLHPADPLHLTQ